MKNTNNNTQNVDIYGIYSFSCGIPSNKIIRVITILLILLTINISIAQEYNKSSIEFEIGGTKIRDITPVKLLNFNLNYRYMFNTKFGAKIDGGYTNLGHNDIDYYSASLQGVLNVGRLLEFESFTKNYTILAGVGGTYTHSELQTNKAILHRISNFHLSGFIDNEIKLTDNVFVKLGLDVITGVNSRPFTTTVSTQTTTILNFNAGFVIALGKYKEHADWYLKEIEQRIDTVSLQPINNTTINNNYTVSNNLEHVFFKHNSYEVGIQGLNAIKKIANNIEKGQRIILTGYASPPASSEYNQILAEKRCLAIRDKFISLGIDTECIFITPYGEIDTIDGLNEDVARYVEIVIK